MAPKEIRALRTRLGLTQEQMATKVGVSVATLRRWETGVNSPSPLALAALQGLQRGGNNGGRR